MNAPRHYHELPPNDVIRATDRCYSEIEHDWLQCPLALVDKPVGNKHVIRRDEPANAVPCYDGDLWYCDGIPF